MIRSRIAAIFLVLFTLALAADGLAQPRKKAASAPITPDEARQLEAVITTDLGVIRFEFLPDKAPRHVEEFIKRAREGFYDGSAFHRMISRGIIQGGDPLLKEAQTPRNRWGTGALNLIADEFSDVQHVRGIVSTVRIPGKANSGGAQFFICSSAQPQLDGQFSAFGQVTEGIEIVDRISMVETDANQLAIKPVKIISLRIERKPEEPFKNATIDEMRKEVLLRTSMGEIVLEMDPALAPEHVRNFLKLVATGWYDRTEFHRIVPGFVIQGGLGATRATGPRHPADKWVRTLKGEFSKERLHERGVLSMARGDDPDSASTSFFIVLGPATHLDGKYSIFGKVIGGFETLDRIEAAARQGLQPGPRIELIEAAIKP